VPYHGDDRYRETIEKLTRRSSVRTSGAVRQERVPQALAEIDVLVVPSIWPENSPLVIQEAFLAGVPVVGSRIGGIPEAVTDGVNGLLFNPGDASDLASKLARLIDEPSLLETLRAGIPPVRTITDDIGDSRALYQRYLTSTRSARPRLAAIVLNFRTPDETLLTVRSLLASRVRIDDIIVVNNDSLDEARPALESVWSRIRYLHTGRNLGFSGGMNAGIREALLRGANRVLLVNSDVIMPPDCVERLEHAFDDQKNGIVGPIVLARGGPDRIASAGMRYVSRTGRMRHLRVGEPVDACQVPSQSVVDGVAGCVMMIRREVFDAIGLLDEDYFFSFEDLDFCLRARRAGFATVVSGTATAYHEGGRSIGVTSPRRLYFAARNHLLMAGRVAPRPGPVGTLGRICSIVTLNLAHAMVSNGASLGVRLGAVVRGTSDYMAGRFGSDVESTSH
jgi:GT2 family glycosyltransferase